MSNPNRKLVVGNWKMNGLAASLDEARALAQSLKDSPAQSRVALCPPATLVERMARALEGSAVGVGGQDCHAQARGAYTGDVSAEMLKDAGARFVIVGHSERRTGYGETNATVAAKVEAVLNAGLEPIICVGESSDQRDAGQAVEVVRAQVTASAPAAVGGKAFAIAYEPIWAIGTGRTPTPDEIAEVHLAIRKTLTELFANGAAAPILYGGSVNPANGAGIMATAEVGGALVGGASLKAADFLAIIRAAG